MKSYAFLFWAYNVIWIGLVLYVALLVTRLKRVDRKLAEVERELLGRRSGDRPSSSGS